ncbi:MAG: hypothetical protein HY695_33700 [Deltaproteobacteria bacterium]|nr:hypothetical protein [Deltaproteobacteria bacterium]
MFVLIGDGGSHYNPVPSCLGLAQEYNLPIIVVVFNNQRYLSMERGLLKYYPAPQKRRESTSAAPSHPAPTTVCMPTSMGLRGQGDRSQRYSTRCCSSPGTLRGGTVSRNRRGSERLPAEAVSLERGRMDTFAQTDSRRFHVPTDSRGESRGGHNL